MTHCELVVKGGVGCAIFNIIGSSVNKKAYEYASKILQEESMEHHPFTEEAQMLMDIAHASSLISRHFDYLRDYFKSVVGVENYEVK